jgi:transposase-like protein
VNVLVISGRYFDRSVTLLCVRWYPAFNLSLHDLEEIMAGRGMRVDHSTIHRRILRFPPLLLEWFSHRQVAIKTLISRTSLIRIGV